MHHTHRIILVFFTPVHLYLAIDNVHKNIPAFCMPGELALDNVHRNITVFCMPVHFILQATSVALHLGIRIYTTTAVWEQQSIEVEYLLWKISHENIFRLNIPTIRTLCSKPCQFNEWCHQVKSRSFWQNVLSYTHVHFMLRQKYDQHRTHCTKGLYLNSWCCHLCQ